MRNEKAFSGDRIRRSCYAFCSIFLVSVFFIPGTLEAQNYDKLVPLKGYKAAVHYSAGNEERAKVLAERCDNVMNYYNQSVRFEPAVTLLVLDPEDWSTYTSFPVYGMPHYNDDKTLIVASRDNEFWKSFIPPVDQLPAGLADRIKETYSDGKGNLSMGAFFDLLAIHELGHAYHFQYGLTMQRKWMAELFANIFLHTYIAENEPEQLAALTLFPQMVISGDRSALKYTSLTDLESRYDEIGQKYPNNYGWYQSRWHAGAADIYNAGGKELFTKLWTALDKQKSVLDDDSLARFLSGNVHQSVADVLLKWDE
ncbi:MAG: hypothetical protein WAV93_11980 [Bacteroidales bacterium]